MKSKKYFLGLLILLLSFTYSCTEVDSISEEEQINNTQGIEDGEITDDDI